MIAALMVRVWQAIQRMALNVHDAAEKRAARSMRKDGGDR